MIRNRFLLGVLLLAAALQTAGMATAGSEDNTLIVGEMFDITNDALDPVEDGSVMAEKP